jgi:ubiquinone biosynthesis protein COQ9
MHTIKQIIENQAEYKNEIISFLNSDMSHTLNVLNNIQTEDPEIKPRLESLKKRVDKMKKPSIHTLFFMSKKRSLKHYAWWDADLEEAIIYNYDKNH